MSELLKITTPAILIDMDVVETNVERFQAYCNKHNIPNRPHIKTHKLPKLAKLQMQKGAFGITCQKISEAEAMIGECDVDDLLITYNILGDEKLQRLKALQSKVKKLTVVADNAFTINGLSACFSQADAQPLNILVECNSGADRCGVESKEEALALAQLIMNSAGLNFGGIMTYPPIAQNAKVQDCLFEIVEFLKANKIEVDIVSCGGTPHMWDAHEVSIATEWRAGTYIYNDKSLVKGNICSEADCALNIMATVVSRPTPNRVIIDAGSKTLTSDLSNLQGYGLVAGHPNIVIDNLSEEHGRLVSEQPIDLEVGQKVRIIPNHVCVISNMVDQVYLTRKDKIESIEKVTARGCIT